MLDLETLSLRPTAAIIQIAAKPFTLDGSSLQQTKEDGSVEPLTTKAFSTKVNATSCAMYGFSFDQSTVDWWSKNEAKEDFCRAWGWYTIKDALDVLIDVINQWKNETKSDQVNIWSQGTDFDISVLREAYRRVFGSEKKLPWKYNNVRDARTYFLEAARLFEPDVEDPYSLIKTDGTKHDALCDCEWSIKAVQWAYKRYNVAGFILTRTIQRDDVDEKWKDLRESIENGLPVMWELKKPWCFEARADSKQYLPAGTKFILRKADDRFNVEAVAVEFNDFLLKEKTIEKYFQPFRGLSKEEQKRYTPDASK